MAEDINEQLQELAALWVVASPESFERISLICGQIEQAAAQGEIGGEQGQKVNPVLLRHAELLAIKAEKRLAECLTILTRTGSYSTAGNMEVTERVATSGWEG